LIVNREWIVGKPEEIRRGPPTKAAGVPHGINTPMRHTSDLTAIRMV